VARAQLRKLDSIIERRRHWCRELTRQLEGIAELQIPRVTPGCEHSYWFYMMRVDPAKLGASADQFADALKAEGLPVAAHYIGQPVYEYPVFNPASCLRPCNAPLRVARIWQGPLSKRRGDP